MRSTILLGALLLLVSAAPVLAEETPEPLSVDYVIGLLQAGMTGDAIVEHILEKELAFVVRKGDIDRLLEAGAGESVLMTVLQSTWSRPRRIDAGEGAEGEPGESDQEGDTDSSVQFYGAFYFGWPGYYYYSPYYYGGYAYYYPYYYPYSYSRGYGGHYGGHYGGKVGVGVGSGGYTGKRDVYRGGHRSGHSRGVSPRGHSGRSGRGMSPRGRSGGSGRGMAARGHRGGSGRGMAARGHGGGRGGRGRGGGRGHR